MTDRTWCWVFTVAATLATPFLGGCGGGPGVQTGLSDHMLEHFEAVIFLETAVIEGNVRAANSQGLWLARHWSPPGVPLTARHHDTEMRYWGTVASEAETVSEAAEALGRTLHVCGSCHADLEVGPPIGALDPPTADGNVQEAMIRHVWSVDVMGEALVARSEDAWSTGSETLLASLVSPWRIAETPEGAARVEPWVDRLRTLSHQARDARPWLDRAQAYAAMLETCSGCHGEVGVEPFGPGP